MGKVKEPALFFVIAAALLAFQFRALWGPGESLFLAIIEDPAPLLSLFPWDVLAGAELRDGHFPLWNAYSGLGMPLIANYQSAVFFPLKWPFYLTGWLSTLDLFVVLRLALAGTFCFLLCRKLGAGRTGAWAGGLFFALTGYFMKHMNQVSVSSEMWLPLCLYLTLVIYERPAAKKVLLASLIYCLVMLGGNPEAAFYVYFISLLFALFNLVGKDGKAGLFIAGYFVPVTVGVLIASVQLLPFIEYLGPGWHIHDTGLHQVAAHPARLLSSLVAPWLLGPSGTSELQKISVPYVGGLCLLLAISGFLNRPRERTALFFAGLFALLMSLVYELPGLGWAGWLPPFNRFGNVKFAMAGAALSVSVLAAFGVSAIFRSELRGRMNSVAVALVGIIMIGGALHLRKGLVPGGVFMPLFFLVVAAAVMAAHLSGKRSEEGNRVLTPARTSRTVAGLAVLELMLLFAGFSVQRGPDLGDTVLGKAPVPEYLQPVVEDGGRPRMTGTGGAIMPNLNILYRLYDLRAFEAMYPRSYVEAISRIEGFEMEAAVDAFFEGGWHFNVSPENLGHEHLDVLAIKYVVAGKGSPAGQEKGLERITAGPAGTLYENTGAFPRAWAEGSGRIVPLKVRQHRGDYVEIECKSANTLYLSDNYFPGWKATSGDDEVLIEKSHGVIRRTKCRGEIMLMIYRPAGFRLGLWTGLSSLIGTIGLVIIFRKRDN